MSAPTTVFYDPASMPTAVSAATPSVDNAAGASGPSNSSISISWGVEVAIIVVVVVAAVFGITSAVLFYLAKKRQWAVKEAIRRSARRMAAPFTPRSARKQQFPRTPRAPPQHRSQTHDRRQSGLSRIPDEASSRQGEIKKKLGVTVVDEEKGLAGPPKTGTTTKVTSTFEVESPTVERKGGVWSSLAQKLKRGSA